MLLLVNWLSSHVASCGERFVHQLHKRPTPDGHGGEMCKGLLYSSPSEAKPEAPTYACGQGVLRDA